MRQLMNLTLIVTAFFGIGTNVQAQLILVGTTGNVTATTPTSKLVDIDITIGQASNPRDTGIFLIGGIAVQPSSESVFGLTTLVSSPANSLVSVNKITGSTSLIGTTGLFDIVEGDLAFNPMSGTLYGIQNGTGPGVQRQIFTINPASGAATIIGPMGTTGDISALAFSPTGVLYGIDSSGTNSSLLHTLDIITGTVNSTTPMNFDLGSSVGMTFNPLTGIAYVADGGSAGATGLLFSLDINTGSLSTIGATNAIGGISGLAFVSVPEPSSLMLVAGAMAVTSTILRRSIKRRPL